MPLEPTKLTQHTQAAVDAFIAAGTAANTVRSYRSALAYWDAWLQLRRANPERNSVPACLALAGAVAGVRWTHLPPKVRADIRQRVKAVRA